MPMKYPGTVATVPGYSMDKSVDQGVDQAVDSAVGSEVRERGRT
jgi:hypothetical protein